jgi:predicted murein hydrolase (TIGR00659 family)
MNERIAEIWVYLAASPLLGLTVTLLAYQGAVWINRRCHGHPLANPVLIAISALVALLWLTGTPYHAYFDGAQFVHFLLGPATVALAIPLYAEFKRLARLAGPLLVALLAGSLTAALSGVLIGKLFGASDVTLMSLAPKSATTPIAMGVAERIGGLPSLTSVLVILTGVLGAVGAQWIYAAIKCDDPVVKGFSLGTASHGIGTARAFQMGEREGAFAALAMGLNGLLTAILLPWLIPALATWLR